MYIPLEICRQDYNIDLKKNVNIINNIEDLC